MYTIESLTEINASFHMEYKINQSDVDIANKYVEIIEKSRTDDAIQAGDIIELTTKHGDYYRNAHVENLDSETNEWSVCEKPSVPFVYISEITNKIKCNTSGGPWSSVPNNLKLLGTRKKMFTDWGHCRSCANGAIEFEATVNVWEYKQPDPLYGDYTTKQYDKHYISYCVDSLGNPKNGSMYRYLGNNIAFIAKEDYEAWRDTFRGVEFTGNWPNQTVVFTYKRIEKLISEQAFESLDLPVDTRRQNGMIKVKFNMTTSTIRLPNIVTRMTAANLGTKNLMNWQDKIILYKKINKRGYKNDYIKCR